MNKCDVILCWPKDVDYPLCRYRINKDRDLFGNIIIIMTQTAEDNDRDYTNYLQSNMARATIVKKYYDNGSDWRNAALNEGLNFLSNSAKSILFLEQDFLVKDGFFEKLLEQGQGYGSVVFKQGNRFHPACLLTKKDILNKTKKDFSVQRDIGDHFYKFSNEIRELGTWTNLYELDLPDWYHMSGLTQNYRLDSKWMNVSEFYTYLRCSGRIDQPADWVKFSLEMINKVSKQKISKKIESFFEGAE